jgi:hypothetical protein
MRTLRPLSSFLLATALIVPMATIGCAEHASYRYYDADHRDYHSWNNSEVVYYSNWENQTHRDHEDFNKRSADEQKEYWNWRHDQH